MQAPGMKGLIMYWYMRIGRVKRRRIPRCSRARNFDINI
jgi:hypothetical protein